MIIGIAGCIILTTVIATVFFCVEKFTDLCDELTDLKRDYAKAIDGKLAAEREVERLVKKIVTSIRELEK